MEKIKLTFLGTGSAIPTPRRNHPAILLQYKDKNILIDCGEGTQTQFRKAHLNPCKITKILITHWHGDHVLGLPGLLQTLTLNGYNKTLRIYGPKGTEKWAQTYINLFAKKGKNFPIEIKEVNGKFLDTAEFCIEAEKMQHDAECNAYSFIIKQKQRLDKTKLKKLNLSNTPLIAQLVKGKTITMDGKKINGKKLIYTEPERKVTVIMDTLYNSNAVKIAKNSSVLICESTYSKQEEKIAKEHFHLTSELAATVAKQSKSKLLILTHISQRYNTNKKQNKILEESKKIFKNTKIAEDLMKEEI